LNLLTEIILLVRKDLLLEWRQKYAFYGALLYLGCTVFVCYLSVGLHGNSISALTWNALFWIILLFAAINAIAKSFIQEGKGRILYYYMLASPQAIILAKIIYNTLLMLFLSLAALGIYSVVLDNPVQNDLLFFINVVLGAIGFASTFTLTSGIASKAGNNGTLMAVLSIPLILPMLLLLMKISKNAIDGLDFDVSSNAILMLIAINFMIVSLSYLLFPYLWRS
jgi:heme exporter protein B